MICMETGATFRADSKLRSITLTENYLFETLVALVYISLMPYISPTHYIALHIRITQLLSPGSNVHPKILLFCCKSGGGGGGKLSMGVN